MQSLWYFKSYSQIHYSLKGVSFICLRKFVSRKQCQCIIKVTEKKKVFPSKRLNKMEQIVLKCICCNLISTIIKEIIVYYSFWLIFYFLFFWFFWWLWGRSFFVEFSFSSKLYGVSRWWFLFNQIVTVAVKFQFRFASSMQNQIIHSVKVDLPITL